MSWRPSYLLVALLAVGPAVLLSCGSAQPRSGAPGRPALAVAPAEDQAGPHELAIVRAAAAVVRTAPSPAAPPLSVVEREAQLLVRLEQGDWCEVQMAKGPPGYVLASAVKLAGLSFHPDEPPKGEPKVVTIAEDLLWTPYVWGGAGASGFDCSGFVHYVFRQVGTDLPRTAAAQSQVGFPVAETELSPGDRLYFADGEGRIVHTGVYCGAAQSMGPDAGGREFVHASSRHGCVVISSLDNPYYARMYAGARR